MNWSNAFMGQIAGIVTAITGLTFPEARRPFSEAAILRVAGRRHLDLSHFARELRNDPQLQRETIDELIVGETYFFRDPEQFAFLSATVLPQIAAELAPRASLSIWCAGCASGEEPYSLAIVLDQLGLASRSRILATDLSHTAIERARQGTFSRWSFRTKARPWRDRWFTYNGNAWHARPELRERVHFETQNLLDFSRTPSENVYDLILCRNVLMYLVPDVTTTIVTSLARALTPNGWLLLSPSDPTPPQSAGVEPTITSAGILYRRVVRPQATDASARVTAPSSVINAVIDAAPARKADLDPNIHVALAMTLLDLNLPEAAITAARRAIYLDATLAVAYFALGRALRQRGKVSAARRALHRAQSLLAKRPPDDAVRCAESITVGTLSANTTAELSLL